MGTWIESEIGGTITWVALILALLGGAMAAKAEVARVYKCPSMIVNLRPHLANGALVVASMNAGAEGEVLVTREFCPDGKGLLAIKVMPTGEDNFYCAAPQPSGKILFYRIDGVIDQSSALIEMNLFTKE